MFNWKEVWEKKGNINSTDLKLLNGYESTSIDVRNVAKKITQALGITKDMRVLEVGCGAGMIANELECKYVGVDYSPSLVAKHKEILNNEVYVCEANRLFFGDNEFDCVFSYSVFHYFPNSHYASEVIGEMNRVSKNGIFIGDLPTASHDEEHLLFKKEDYSKWDITEGYYNPSRFNMRMFIGEDYE